VARHHIVRSLVEPPWGVLTFHWMGQDLTRALADNEFLRHDTVVMLRLLNDPILVGQPGWWS
jgi:hypothetical protein